MIAIDRFDSESRSDPDHYLMTSDTYDVLNCKSIQKFIFQSNYLNPQNCLHLVKFKYFLGPWNLGNGIVVQFEWNFRFKFEHILTAIRR